MQCAMGVQGFSILLHNRMGWLEHPADCCRTSSTTKLEAASRRDFMETTVTTVLGSSVVGSSSSSVTDATTKTTTTNPTEPSSSVSPIVLPPMGLGAWAWGDSLFWGCKLIATSDTL
jgi:hypothetical protein